MLKKRLPLLVILSLSIITSLVIIFPVLKGGQGGIFFSIDPDAHFMGSIFSYIKLHQIQYINHPGTPSILLYSYLLTPLRIYSHFVAHTNFILWAVNNINIVYFYLRIMQVLIFCISLTIFSSAIYKITKSIYSCIFALLALLTFSFFPNLAVYIGSETVSFLIISIWLLVFSYFLESKSPKTILLLSAIAGLSVANKFTNIFYFFISIILIVTLKNVKKIQKVYYIFLNLLTGFATFIVFTWPIRDKYSQLLKWLTSLATHTQLYGSGTSEYFNPVVYLTSINTLISTEIIPTIIFISTIGLVFFYSMKRIYLKIQVKIVTIILMIGIIIFSKYPLSYYQLIQFIGIVFIAAIVYLSFPKYLKLLILFFLFYCAFQNLNTYNNHTTSLINETVVLDRYIKLHPAKIASIWEWGRNKDFALLWGNTWSGGSYSEELAKLKPNMYQLDIYDDKTKSIFNLCWDKLYIQKISSVAFVEKYSDKKLNINSIEGANNMLEIESDHCLYE